MSNAFSSKVTSTNAGCSFELDGNHPSRLETSSLPQANYDAHAKSSLSSNAPDTTQNSFKGHGTGGNSERHTDLEHSADEVSERNSSLNQKTSHYRKKMRDSSQGDESPILSERVSVLQAATSDAAGGAWGSATPSGRIPGVPSHALGGVDLEALAGLTLASPFAGEGSSLPLITSNDYSDRQRLLYHVTYLHTQLQRAFLQIQEQQRILTILQATAGAEVERADRRAADPSPRTDGPSRATEGSEKGAAGERVVLRISASCTAAAVAAARTEEALHAALHESLAQFDPLIAQSQIQRLDDALAHLSLLREAELQQLRRGEEELRELRNARNDLVERVDSLQGSCEKLTATNEGLRASLASTSLEVERLRQEELRLSRRIVAMEGLMQTGNLYDGVQIVDGGGGCHQPREGASASVGLGLERATHGTDLDIDIERLNALSEEEGAARQALLLDLFWEPMLMAFDAGLTWTEEYVLLTEERNNSILGKGAPHGPGGNALSGLEVAAQTEDSTAVDELAAAMRAPATDADLLLLRNQQEEIQQLQRQVGMLKERQRMVDLEKERLESLYASEQRRSENLARDHSVQLQRAYQELLRDRQMITQQLRKEVEEQVRIAFHDGRQYERQHLGAISVSESSMPDSLRDAEKAPEARHLNGKRLLTHI